MISRSEALILLKTYIKNQKLIYHSLASEAVMKALAVRLGKDEEKWGLAGLLHDIDAEITNNTMEIHGKKAAEILRENQVEEEIIEAVVMHNEQASKKQRTEVFHHLLAAAETLTGLIYATALVYPDKKIEQVKSSSVIKRMPQKAFAASVNRDTIKECEKAGLAVEEFVSIALDAMKSVAKEIGL